MKAFATAVLALVAALVALVSAQDLPCEQYKTAVPCLTNTTCNWCRSAAVSEPLLGHQLSRESCGAAPSSFSQAGGITRRRIPCPGRCPQIPSTCLTYDYAKRLPPGSFQCGNASRTDCTASTDATSCAANVGCVWCSSKTVRRRGRPSVADGARLGAARLVLHCAILNAPAIPPAASHVPRRGAQVKSSCRNYLNASHLPPSVFACATPTEAMPAEEVATA